MIEVQSGRFTLLCERTENGLMITGYEGRDAKLFVPLSAVTDKGEERITEIAKKAFLGCTGLREISLEKSILSIGDWAFSQCVHLTSVSFASEALPTLGRSVFDGCARLSEIYVGTHGEALAYILASVVSKLPATHLLRDEDVGSREWYERFDLSLKALLKQDDYEGFSDTALCGEEDISYDGIGSVDGELLGESYQYIKEVSKNKAMLALLRLRYCEALSCDMEQFLKEYIKSHSLGEDNPAAWYAIKEGYRDDVEYLKLYMEIVKPDSKGVDAMIMDIGDDLAQAKAFLIKEEQGKKKEDAFFNDLLL